MPVRLNIIAFYYTEVKLDLIALIAIQLKEYLFRPRLTFIKIVDTELAAINSVYIVDVNLGVFVGVNLSVIVSPGPCSGKPHQRFSSSLM